MSAPQLVYNGNYSWQGFGNRSIGKWKSSCHLIIFKFNQTPVVIVEERNNSGTSVTNCAENIAALICRDFDLNPLKGNGLIWFESYPEYKDENDVSSVSFSIMGNPTPERHLKFPGCQFLFSAPKWSPLNEQTSELFYALNDQVKC